DDVGQQDLEQVAAAARRLDCHVDPVVRQGVGERVGVVRQVDVVLVAGLVGRGAVGALDHEPGDLVVASLVDQLGVAPLVPLGAILDRLPGEVEDDAEGGNQDDVEQARAGDSAHAVGLLDEACSDTNIRPHIPLPVTDQSTKAWGCSSRATWMAAPPGLAAASASTATPG